MCLVSWDFLSQRSLLRPFSEVSPVWASGHYLEGDEVPGARDLVEAKASDTGDLRIDPRVVVRAGASYELVECQPLRLGPIVPSGRRVKA